MELYPKDFNKEPAELYATNEHTVNFSQAALFEKLNEEYADHFIHDVVPVKKESFQRVKLLQKKPRSEQGQNLKSVSRHIINLLMMNPNIKLRNLSHIIYEIMNMTDLGGEIVE